MLFISITLLFKTFGDNLRAEGVSSNYNGNGYDNNLTKDDRSLPDLEKGEDIHLKDGIYKLNVELYHERENKQSMGNNGVVHEAELIAEDGKYTMLIGSKKMTAFSIVASLVSLQIRNDNAYYFFAKPYSYSISIPGYDEKRPEVFTFDITRKDTFVYVKVDPRVEAMGDVPIGARLKFDWSSLKNIKKTEAKLYEKMLSGETEKEFDKNKEVHSKAGNFELIAQPNTFDESIIFKADSVDGGNLFANVIKKLGRSRSFKIYKFRIENKFGKNIVPKKSVTIKSKIGTISNPEVMKADDMKPIQSKISNGYVSFDIDQAREYIFAEKTNSKSVASTKNSSTKASYKNSSKANTSSQSSKKLSNSGVSTPKKSNDSNVAGKEQKDGSSDVTSLKNTSTNFDYNANAVDDSAEKTPQKEASLKSKESPKIIFFSLLFFIALIGGLIYTYVNFGKRLTKELNYHEFLKNKIRSSKIKTFLMLGVVLSSICIFSNSSHAAEVFTAETHAYYAHPVTGKIEDAGNNPGIGNGMVTNTTYGVSLIEKDDDGKLYATIRIKLRDKIKDFSFAVQNRGVNSWTDVPFEEISNSGDEGDFRFEIPSTDCVVRLSFFVMPMGRAVVYYADFSDLEEGSGNFKVSVDTNGKDTSTVRENENTGKAQDPTTSILNKTSKDSKASKNSTSKSEVKNNSTKTPKTTKVAIKVKDNKSSKKVMSKSSAPSSANNDDDRINQGDLGYDHGLLTNKDFGDSKLEDSKKAPLGSVSKTLINIIIVIIGSFISFAIVGAICLVLHFNYLKNKNDDLVDVLEENNISFEEEVSENKSERYINYRFEGGDSSEDY